jgi:hypothetical protein
MLGPNLTGDVHAPPSFPCKTTPCWPTVWSGRTARPAQDRPIPVPCFARPNVTPGPSRPPAKPSFRATETAPSHDHDESLPAVPPGADFHTLAASPSVDPNSSPAEVLHRFFFRRFSARSIDRGLIEMPKRFRIASVTSFSIGEVARHCSTKSRTSSVHL